MNFKTVDSSNLEKFAYDAAEHKLYIVFARTGKVYRYDDVPAAVVQGLVDEANRKLTDSQASVGSYFNTNIRRAFAYKELSASELPDALSAPTTSAQRFTFRWVDLNSRIAVEF